LWSIFLDQALRLPKRKDAPHLGDGKAKGLS